MCVNGLLLVCVRFLAWRLLVFGRETLAGVDLLGVHRVGNIAVGGSYSARGLSYWLLGIGANAMFAQPT